MVPPEALPAGGTRTTRTTRSLAARLVGNTAALVVNDLINRAITFVLYALIARYLGAYEFGQMSITLTVFYLLQSLAPLGLKMLLVRETARQPADSGSALVQGSLVALGASILALWLLLGFLFWMDYAPATTRLIMLVSVGLIPYSLSAVCEAIFQAHEQIRWITAANVPISLGRGLAAWWILAAGLDLYWIGVLFLVSFTATWLLEWLLLTRHVVRPDTRPERDLFLRLARGAVPFIGLQGVIAVTNSILPLFLSKSHGEVQVGLFNAANQIMAPVLLVSQSVVVSLFPRLCQKVADGSSALALTTRRLIELLLGLSLPAVIGLLFYARFALLLIYGRPIFAISALLLQLMAASLLFRAVTSVLGRVLLASGRERTLLSILLLETGACLGLAFALIPRWGVLGAALAGLIVTLIDLILHLPPIFKLLGPLPLGRAAWKAVNASLVLIVWLVFATGTALSPWLGILVSLLLYPAVWLALAVLEAGGWRKFLAGFALR